MVTIAPRFAGLPQFEKCLAHGRMTKDGFDGDGNLVVDEPNDPEAVASIQRALRDLKYDVKVTRVYDDQTYAAVAQFKVDQQLAIPPGLAHHDGVTGPGTSGRLNKIFTPPAAPVVSPLVPTPAFPGLEAWEELISFRPPVAMQATLQGRFSFFGGRIIHAIEDARGPINLDFYPVRVDVLPRSGAGTMTPEQLLETIRRDFNRFVDNGPDGCTFSPYEPLIDTGAWLPPFLPMGFPGAVVSIKMFAAAPGLPLGVNVDSGSVVASEVASDHWRFSTIWTPGDGGHPVSGNREWGFRPSVAGAFTFYTRGADRATAWIDDLASSTVFGAAHRLWLSFQRRVAAFVNGNGGRAEIEAATSARYDWPTVQADYHRPVTPWAR